MKADWIASYMLAMTMVRQDNVIGKRGVGE